MLNMHVASKVKNLFEKSYFKMLAQFKSKGGAPFLVKNT